MTGNTRYQKPYTRQCAESSAKAQAVNPEIERYAISLWAPCANINVRSYNCMFDMILNYL